MEQGTARLETFSDGVFAIAATLLVLEFSVGSGRNLGHQLVHRDGVGREALAGVEPALLALVAAEHGGL